MVDFVKHVGQNQYGSRIVVVFREIPGAEDYCLCVETDSLMEMYHDQLIREVNSQEAQNTVNLHEVLTRRHFGDGQQMLNGLHNKGLLRKYKISDITMVPMPNRTVPLEMVNKQISGEDIENTDVVKDVKDTEAPTKLDESVIVDTEKGLAPVELKPAEVEPVTIGKLDEDATKKAAESKLLQARLMEEDAKSLREEAYKLDPSLKKGGRPSKKQIRKSAKVKAK